MSSASERSRPPPGPRPLRRLLALPLAIGLDLTLRLTDLRAGIAIVYHRIGNRTGDPRRELMPPTHIRQFRDQLRHLTRRYAIVPVEALPQAISARRRGHRFPVCLTFDDDLPEHIEHVMPELQKRKVPATFFLGGASAPGETWATRLQRAFDIGCSSNEIMATLPRAVSDSIESSSPDIHKVALEIRRLARSDRNEVSRRLLQLAGPDSEDAGLATEDIARLAGTGFRIGFHTVGHDALPTLGDRELEEALIDGREQLARIADQRIDVIAYPHGRADGRVGVAARRAGYRLGFTTEWEAATPASDPMRIGRLEPSDPSLGRFSLKLARALWAVRGSASS